VNHQAPAPDQTHAPTDSSPDSRTAPSRPAGKAPCFRGAFATLLAVCLLSGLPASAADAPIANEAGAEVLPPPTEETVLTDLEATPEVDSVENLEDDGSKEAVTDLPLVPQRGHWGFYAGATVRSFYDNNIFIQPTNRHGDWITQAEPFIHVGVGDYIAKAESFASLEYAARASVFATNHDQNSLDHDLQIVGLKQISRFDLHFGVRVKTATDPNIDAGQRSRSQTYEGILNARYELTGHTALESDFLARNQEYTGLLNSSEIRFTEWFAYRATSRIEESIGLAYGNLWASAGPTQTYGQLLSRTRLLESSTLTAGLNLGVEYRAYEGVSKTDVTPILSLALDYDSHAGTVVHLEAFRRTESSTFYIGENRLETGIAASCRQHLARNWSAALTAEIGETQYRSTTDSSTNSGRRDLVYSLTPSVIYEPNEHWSASIFFQARRNDSTQDNFRFDDLQAGVAVNFHF
jgi:hypothetical protein